MSAQLFLISIASALISFGGFWWLSAPLRKHAGSDARLAIVALAVFPMLAILIYVGIGNPYEPDQPLAPRLEGELADLPPGAILVRLEQQLRAAPEDAVGWRLMARLRGQLSMHEQAADAWQRVIALNAGDGEAYAGLAQSLIEVDGGVVSDPVIALLDEALARERDNMSALFWRAVAWQQQGENAKARALWAEMREKLPDNIPLSKALDERLKAAD
jgi:cytochrome c-type biogenesis protein CcmH